MAEKILAFRIDVEGTSKEADAISRIDIELNKLNEERREAIVLSKKEGEAGEKARVKLAQLSSQTKDLQVKKAELNRVERASAREFKATGGSMEQLRARTAKLRAEINQLDISDKKNLATLRAKKLEITANTKKIRDFDRSISGSSTLVGEYSRGLVNGFRGIGIALVGVLASVRLLSNAVRSVTNDFAKFETGQMAVQGLLDEQNNLIAGQTIDIMKSYGLETQDTNKALFDAVSAGVEAGKSNMFMAEASKLALGGVTSLSTAVDGMTTIINSYHLATDDANQVASAFFSAQKFGKTTVEELSKSVGRAAPVAKQLDVTYQELLATYAILTKNGIATEEAGTAIRSMMVALQKTSKEQRDAFDRLGISYGATNVKAEGFFNIMSQIQQAVAAGDAELIELIPNIRALTGAGTLGAEALAEYDEILKVVNEDYGEGSSLAKAFALQQNSVRNYMDRLGASFRAGRIALGSFLAPLLKGFVDIVAPIKRASDSIREQKYELNALVKSATSVLASDESRIRTIKQIQEQYPDFLKNIDAETISNDQLATALAKANTEYDKRIKYEIAKEVYEIQKTAIAELIIEEGNLIKVYENALEAKKEVSNEEVNLLSTAIRNKAIIQEQTIPKALERNRAKQAEMNEAIEKSIQLISEMNIVSAGGEPGGGGEDPDDKKKRLSEEEKKRLVKIAELRLQIQRQTADSEIAIIQDRYDREFYKEVESYQRFVEDMKAKAVEYPELQKEIDAVLEAVAIEHEINLQEIILEGQEEQHKIRMEKDKEAEEQQKATWDKRVRIAEFAHQAISELFSVLHDSYMQQKAIELEQAGDNEKRREEIERKYARKMKIINIGQAIMNGALAVTKALAHGLPIWKWIEVGLIGATTLAQTAIIAAQKFATSGKVKPGYELPGSSKGEDNTLALVKPGEVILNERHQALLGGPMAFKRIGVPGFAGSGLVGGALPPVQDAGNISIESFTRGISAVLGDLRVVLNVNELHSAEDELAIITETL